MSYVLTILASVQFLNVKAKMILESQWYITIMYVLPILARTEYFLVWLVLILLESYIQTRFPLDLVM